jgi:hypothetical protein
MSSLHFAEMTGEFFDKLRAGEGKIKLGYFIKDAPKGKMVEEWNGL